MTTAAVDTDGSSRAGAVCGRCDLPGCVHRSNVGALVRRLRLASGLGTRALAKRTPCARTTVERLEAGEFRPRPSLLGCVANAINPDRKAEILALLMEAAGPCLAPDTDGTLRWRHRLVARAMLRGEVPLPDRIARAIKLHPAADAAWRQFVDLTDQAFALPDDDPRQAQLLEHAQAVHDESQRLRELAGPPVTLWIRDGHHTIRRTYGLALP